MNQAVPHNQDEVVKTLPAADCNNRSSTTTRNKDSTAIITKTEDITPVADVTPPIEANRRIP